MGTAPKAPKASEPPPLAVKVGDLVLERYRIVEHIASGGHSVVFRGQDERLSRPVCIKVFSGMGGNSGVGRTSYEHFVQEAFALSRLTHPNTLRIYDFGHLGPPRVTDPRGSAVRPEPEDAAGMPLQVCEYMNGGTLSHMVREQGRQSLAETVRVIHAMCLALAEAHGLGIVHRDIKPQNVFDAGPGTIWKILDFGVATLAEDGAATLTHGGIVGTPSYMAPEQAQGRPLDGRADLYALAAVAYRCATGRHPFSGADTPALLYAVVHRMPPRPGELAALPADVDAWFALALAKRPDDRFATGAALADALDAALAGALDPALRRRAESVLRKLPGG
jgi:serine/threonine-protein kinase